MLRRPDIGLASGFEMIYPWLDRPPHTTMDIEHVVGSIRDIVDVEHISKHVVTFYGQFGFYVVSSLTGRCLHK